MRYAKLAQAIGGYLCTYLLFPCPLKAQDASLDWQAQLYGGEYYKDTRVGAYGIASKGVLDDFAFTGEILYERYRGGDNDGYDDYSFAGAGAHFLWNAKAWAKFGLVGSHSHDEYRYDAAFVDPKSEYVSNTLGFEGELDLDPVTLALQVGKISTEYYNNDHAYLSMDAYYWGADYLWLARGAVRRSRNYEEYTIEAYRTFFPGALPLSLYAGATTNDLTTEEELRTYHTQYDSYYTGGYLEFLTTTSSAWSLWVEAARYDKDTILSVELNITFGPGVVAPYISAFGFTP
ncbi:MAG: hypothetical protein PVI91_08290 [Gammaproteobacteria bacterium]